MGSFNQPPLQVPGWFDTVAGMHWMYQFWNSTKGAASTADNVFNGAQVFSNGSVNVNGPVLLTAGEYYPVLDIEQVLHNSLTTGLGGTAGIYVQVSVDNSLAQTSTLHSGIRVQLQTQQQAAAGVPVNDCVAGYFGLYNNGINTGGFGYHVDAYHAATGGAPGTGSPSTYGCSVELFRTSAAGFTVGAHVRSIGGGSYLKNDYGFLVSPASGSLGSVGSLFAGGAVETGTITADFGLDLRNSNILLAGAYFLDDTPMVWGDNIASHTRRIVGSSSGFMGMYFNSNLVFSVTDGGFAQFNSAGYASSAGAATGTFLEFIIAGVGAFKVALLAP